jgi:uncharacterized protein with FMN-binding domain
MDYESNNKQPNGNNQKMVASFIVILAVVVIAVGITYFTHKKDSGLTGTATSTVASNSPTATNSAAASDTATASSAGTSSGTYKDGTYSAGGSYQTPGGQESISMTITVKNNIVTDTTLQQNANNRDSREYQAAFASGYKSKVIGKALSSISLSRVSGSSLTSDGFNSALEQIKSQAS